MEIIGTPHSFFGQILPVDFRPIIFRLIRSAWDRINRAKNINLETRITGLLVQALIDEQEAQFDGDPPFQIHEEVKIRDRQIGKENNRTDLEIYLRSHYFKGQRPFFIFEAKRLNVKYESGMDSNADKYIGSDGMGCLLTEKYRVVPGFGGMLGYVMDGQSLSARNSVENSMLRSKHDIALVEPPVFRVIGGEGQCCGWLESRHVVDQSEITVFHIFLEVDCN